MSKQKYEIEELREKCSPDKAHCGIGVRQLAFVFERYDAEKSRADKNADDLRKASGLAIKANIRAEKAEAEKKHTDAQFSQVCLDNALLRTRSLAAEAEVARLTKERDWLADKIGDFPCWFGECPFGCHRPTGPDDDDCDKTRPQCWKEAARKAVAVEGK